MKQLQLFAILIYLGLAFPTQGQDMYILNPQQWGHSDAFIENVEYEVKPAGIYAEISVAFDLFARPDSWFDDGQTQLEFIWHFRLDEKAVFNDSWLWIDDYISYGEIYEVNNGTAIYESIVDRRQDPSILTKTSSSSYNFRVYPLKPDSTRRVKLSYLMPLDFQSKNPTVELGMIELFEDAANNPENISVTVYDGVDWYHRPPEFDKFDYEISNGSTTYKILRGEDLNNWLVEFTNDDPHQDLYFGTYESNDENYYQLVYYPDFEIEKEPTYNLLLLDFNSVAVDFTRDQFLTELEHELFNLNEQDHFSIATSKFTTRFTSESWLPATKENIEVAMSKIRDEGIDNRSNLSTLLPECLNFIEENNQKATLYIVSGNNEYYYENDVENFLEPILEFIDEMAVSFEIGVNDFAHNTRRTRLINGIYYSGSEYLYKELVDYIGGQYYGYAEGDDYKEGLIKMLTLNSFTLEEFDFDIELENGFTYSNYFNNGGSGGLDVDQPVIATGKYVGSLPAQLELNALHNGQFLNETIAIEENNLSLSALAKTSWHAEYILDNEYSGNSVIKKEVIETSMEERLLSAQTVFLCLEEDTTTISSNLENNDIVLATDEISGEEADIIAYPNPFLNTLNLKFPETFSGSSLILEFNDLTGRLINRQERELIGGSEELSYSFEGMATLESGMYIIRVIAGSKIYNIKVMHVQI